MTNLIELKKKIDAGENFSFVKMGDGEMMAMLGAKGENCDGQQYSEKLASALKEAYKILGKLDNIHITRWKLGMEKEIKVLEEELGVKCTADHDMLLNRVNEVTADHFAFWKTIKESQKNKFFIGPARIRKVAAFLGVKEYTEIPLHNAFDYNFNMTPETDAIYLFSAGLATKVWIAKLLKENPNITCIDCGSAFDPLYVGETRTNQVNMEGLKDFYGPLLKVTPGSLRGNFGLPQIIHPERLYAVKEIGNPIEKIIYDLGCSSHKTMPEAIGVDILPTADVQSSIDNMPFIPNESVDFIISRHSLEHLLDTVKTLNEWERILKNGGKIVLILPDHEVLDTMQSFLSGNVHMHAFSRESLANILQFFPSFHIEKMEPVIDCWSFGTIITKKI